MKRKKKCKTMDLPEGDEKLKQQKQWGELRGERERERESKVNQISENFLLQFESTCSLF